MTAHSVVTATPKYSFQMKLPLAFLVIPSPEFISGCCSYLGLFMCGHPEEGQEDRPVDGALHVGHRRRGGQGGEVEATRSVMQV